MNINSNIFFYYSSSWIILSYERNNNYRNHKNADSSDLFKYLNKYGKKLPKNVMFEQVMDEWVNKPGYPVVNVIRKEKTYEISQKRFLLYGSKNSTTKWWVPLTYFRLSNINEITLPELWLSPKDEFVNVDVKEGDGIIFNTLQTGEQCVSFHFDILAFTRFNPY